MNDDSVAEIVRESRRKRYLGPGAQCELCGERNMWALLRHGDRILCYGHRLQELGHSPDEQHHVIGKHNSGRTRTVPANLHRILSAYQEGWPVKTRRNPHRSPLRVLAAAFRSEADIIRLREEQAELMEHLDDWLYNRFGPRWSDEFERYRRRRTNDT